MYVVVSWFCSVVVSWLCSAMVSWFCFARWSTIRTFSGATGTLGMSAILFSSVAETQNPNSFFNFKLIYPVSNSDRQYWSQNRLILCLYCYRLDLSGSKIWMILKLSEFNLPHSSATIWVLRCTQKFCRTGFSRWRLRDSRWCSGVRYCISPNSPFPGRSANYRPWNLHKLVEVWLTRKVPT